jgi:protein BCP1
MKRSLNVQNGSHSEQDVGNDSNNEQENSSNSEQEVGNNSEQENSSNSEQDDEKEKTEEEIVQVDFDFCQPLDSDFHLMKTLLNQTFSTEAKLLNISQLSDKIISSISTCVKVDDSAYAVISCLNYSDSGLDVLFNSRITCPTNTGVVINERLLNMPHEIAPPMFKLLFEEINHSYAKYLFILKLFKKVYSQATPRNHYSQEPPKKQKHSTEFEYYQPEDEIIASFAEELVDYQLPNLPPSESRRVFTKFGTLPYRQLALVCSSKIGEMLDAIQKTSH